MGEETRDHGSRGLRHHHHDEDDDMVVMETEDIKPIITEGTYVHASHDTHHMTHIT